MFRYNLRTLLILLAIGPPVLAIAWREAKRTADAIHAARMRAIHAPMTSELIQIEIVSPDEN